MANQYSVNSMQNEVRQALSLDTDDYRIEVHQGDIEGRFIGLKLKSVFQPIFDLSSEKALGYEALLRAFASKGDEIAPLKAFVQAEIAGQLIKFDRVCRTLHTLNFLNISSYTRRLFLNVHPQLLVTVNSHGKVFERVLHDYSLSTSQVVIEIPESAVKEQDLLEYAIKNYRERGYKIAIDNFGSEHTSLERLWLLSPDYVKFDRSLIYKAETNARLQKVLPRLVQMVHDLGGLAIFEGVETNNQIALAKFAGANLAQGYWLGHPDSALHWDDTKSVMPTTRELINAHRPEVNPVLIP
jgi:EAL domain-containing protein (putative c-di-GMP-specific phosphodiesterase class I)